MVAVTRALEPDCALAQGVFDELRTRTSQGTGIVRDSYGPGEETAHEIVRAMAETLGIEVARDAAANLYMTLSGRDRTGPALIIGSHLDSVPQGGNYDGAAGVVAGLVALACLHRAGFIPPFDIVVMAIRAEEAAWFDASYIGSSAAFGRLPAEILDSVRRPDTGRTLAEHDLPFVLGLQFLVDDGVDLLEGRAVIERGIANALEIDPTGDRCGAATR